MYSKALNKNIKFTSKVGVVPSVKVYLADCEKRDTRLQQTFPQLWKVTNNSSYTK